MNFRKSLKACLAMLLAVVMTCSSVFAAPSMSGFVGGVEESVGWYGKGRSRP